MSAFPFALYRRASLPERLQFLSVVTYVFVFAAFVALSRPGLGIGEGFYVPIVLASLAGTLATGVAAGVAAGTLYGIGLLLVGAGFTQLSAMRALIHLCAYVVVGATVGYFAVRARGMLSQALQVLEELLQIARRDLDTGVLTADGFGRRVEVEVATGAACGLLVGQLDCRAGDDAELRQVAKLLLGVYGEDAELARIGPAHFALLRPTPTLAGAREAAEELERMLEQHGYRATFGWSAHPAEGRDTWSLFRAAHERLYARRIARGEWSPDAVSAGLVQALPQHSRQPAGGGFMPKVGIEPTRPSRDTGF